jgi:hypothetical protein
LLFIRDGHVLATGTPKELRSRAHTDNLETAFLSFAAETAGAAAGVATATATTAPAAEPKETAR